MVGVAAVLGGCAFDHSGIAMYDGGASSIDASVDDTSTRDARPSDADVPRPDASCVGDPIGFEPSNFSRCSLVGPNASRVLSSGTFIFDSTTGALTPPVGPVVLLEVSSVSQAGGQVLNLVTVSSLTIEASATLRITGGRPTALVSLGDMTIDGAISVSATGTTSGPAGGVGCGTSTGANGGVGTAMGGEAGTGGGGGGFGAVGGAGGPVDTAQPPGGGPRGNATLVPLRGGCPGGTGGNSGGGAPGGGGGALQLVAAGTVSIGGTVAAAGGGGQDPTATHAGGGGGGAGGGLLFEAQTVTIDVTGRITANGGGGGEGTRTNDSSVPGSDGHENDNAPAAGGVAGASAGDGGNGGAGTIAAQPGGLGIHAPGNAAGGGGGGGAVGRIHLRAASIMNSGVVSPPPQ